MGKENEREREKKREQEREMEGYQHGGERKEGKRLSRIFYVVTRSRFNPLLYGH